MTTEIAIILLLDGIANGAIYLLAGLGLVLIFSVTRVVFVPFGDITAFCVLSIAAFELGRPPGTIWVVAILAAIATVIDVAGHVRSGEAARIPRSLLFYGLLPLIPCALAWFAAAHALPHAVQIVLAIVLVLPIAPLLDRIAFRPAADASVLVLLIIALALHFALSGLGLMFFGAEGFRIRPVVDGIYVLGGGVIVSAQVLLMVITAALLSLLFFLFFERSMSGRALRATAVNRIGARLVGIRPARTGTISLFHRLAAGRRLRHPGRADHDDLLRFRLHDRAEGLYRRHHRRLHQLSGRSPRRGAGRHHGKLCLVLEQFLQGSDRLRPADPGAALAVLEDIRTCRRGRRRTRNAAGDRAEPAASLWPDRRRHHCAADRAAPARQLRHHAAQLYRHLRAGRAWPGAADRDRRHDVVWTGRLCRHRRLCHRLGNRDARPVAVDRTVAGAGHDRARGACDRRADAAARRAFPLAQHHRLGHLDLFPVRQCRRPRAEHRHDRHPADHDSDGAADLVADDLLSDLVDGRPRDAGERQSAQFARGPRDQEPARRQRAAGEPRRRYLPHSPRHFRARRIARGTGRLALCAYEPVRQPCPVRRQTRHRISADGDGGRRRPYRGRGRRLRADHAVEELAAGRAAAGDEQPRAIRDHRLQHPLDPAAAERPRRPHFLHCQAPAQGHATAARGRRADGPPRAARERHADPEGRGRGADVRRADRRQQGEFRAQGRRDPRPDRPQRRRQEHDVQPADRRAAGQCRPHHFPWAKTSRAVRRWRSRGWGSRAPSSTSSCART